MNTTINSLVCQVQIMQVQIANCDIACYVPPNILSSQNPCPTDVSEVCYSRGKQGCKTGFQCLQGRCQGGSRYIFFTSNTTLGNFGGQAATTLCDRAASSNPLLAGRSFAPVYCSPTQDLQDVYPFNAIDSRAILNTVNQILAPSAIDIISIQNLPTFIYDEFGGEPNNYAWTGCNEYGTTHAQTCNSWTSTSGSDTGSLGFLNQGGGGWLQSNVVAACNQNWSLYCIENS